LFQILFVIFPGRLWVVSCRSVSGQGCADIGHSTQGRGWLSESARQLAAAHTVRKLRLHLPEPYDNVHPALPSPYVDHQVSEECKDIGVRHIHERRRTA
jgi:hypothetical protein